MMCIADPLMLYSSSRLVKQVQHTQEINHHVYHIYTTIASRYDSFHSLPHLSVGLYIYSMCELCRNRHNLESQLPQEPLKDNRKCSINWQPTAQWICIRLASFLFLLLMYRKIQV